MGTWMKEIPPKMVHDSLGLYKGQWLPEMDRAWVRKEDGVSVYSRLIRTPWGNVEHVTITRGSKGISFDGSGDLTWMEKYQIKNELFGEKRAAVEVYPKEDRLVDTCDVYHLWVFDKKFTMPFGIHPKEYQHAVNRGYSISEAELEEIQQYHQVSGNTKNGG